MFSNNRDKINKPEQHHDQCGMAATRQAGKDHSIMVFRLLSSFSTRKDPAQGPSGCTRMGAAKTVTMHLALAVLWAMGFGDVTFDCGPSLSPMSP